MEKLLTALVAYQEILFENIVILPYPQPLDIPISTMASLDLKSFLDSFLRGLESNPPLDLWWNNLVYNHPPAGATVRLSINLNLQKTLDDLLGNHNGSIIAMNARSGEILSIVSHPWIDPSNLDAIWETIISRPKFSTT